jgi:quercetin dioxygenase-like cupin family protein
VADATLLAPGEGETIFDTPRATLRVLADRDELALTWFRYAPGEDGPEPHVHRRHTDAFYVLEGELDLGLGPDVERVRATAGAFVAAPPNVVHTFRNASDAPAIFLNVHAPSAGFVDMLRARREGRNEDAERFDQLEPPADGGCPLADAVVAHPDESERFDRENRVIVIKCDLPQISVFDIVFDTDFEVAPHRHHDQVDSFYVLQNEVEFTLESRTVRAGPGTWVSAPPGALHGFRHPGGPHARVLNIHAPDAGFAASIRG